MNILKNIQILTYLILLTNSVFGQNFKGSIFDSKDSSAIPFVNLYLLNNQTGTQTNLDGRFDFNRHFAQDTLSVTCVGYEGKRILVDKNTSEIVVFLDAINSNLEEVKIVASKVKPSHRLMKKIVAHKKQNSLNSLDNYSVEKYASNTFSISNLKEDFGNKGIAKKIGIFKGFIDTTSGKNKLPIVFQERFSKQYKSGGLHQEQIIHEHSIGNEMIDISSLAGNKNNRLSVYRNNLLLFDKNVASPISQFWKTNYEYFKHPDTLLNGIEYYRLSFTPKRIGQIGLQGEMYVDKETYAVKKVIGFIPSDANLNFIKHYQFVCEYESIDGKLLVKSKKQEFELSLSEKENSKLKTIHLEKVTSFNNFNLKPDLKDVNFTLGHQIHQKKEVSNSDLKDLRPEEISKNGIKVIQLHDSLKTNKPYERFKNLLYMTSTGYYPVQYIEIGHFYKFFSYNRYEKVRLRMDIRTSTILSKVFRVKGFVGYGFGDKRWKYGGELIFRTHKKRFSLVKFSYKYDIEQLGITENNQRIGATFGALMRTAPMHKLFYHQNANISWRNEWIDGLSTTVGINLSQFEQINRKPFLIQSTNTNEFVKRQRINSTELRFRLRYAKDEKKIQGVFKRKSLGSAKPIITLDYSFAPKGLLQNQYQYHKIDFSILQEPPIGILGRIKYKIFAGISLGATPYPFAKIHEGNQSYYLQKYSFNLMRYMEYTSDKYAGFFFEHHLNGLIMDRIPWVRKAKLRLLWTANFVIGGMNERNVNLIKMPQGTKSLNGKPYSEVGFGIENIFKVFRLDFVWRLTDIQQKGINKSWGIMGRVQIEF